MKDNPLLATTELPAFSAIQSEHAVPAMDVLLDGGRKEIDRVVAETKDYAFDNVIAPLEESSDRIDRAWSPIRHLHAVADNPELRQAYNACLKKLSIYQTELGQNEALYHAYRAIAESSAYPTLREGERKLIDNALRDFRLGGVDLAPAAKSKFKAISTRLSELSSKFGENVLDATQAWKKHIENESALRGLPDTAKSLARSQAQRDGKTGWVLTLEFPSYLPTITYADDEALRREIYDAYGTRASDQGPHASRWDNTSLMVEILSLRKQLANSLGFESFAEYSVATKMARDPDEVLGFLQDLAERSKPVATRELDELETFARGLGADRLNTWDLAYYSEKLREQRFDFSQEELRPYFPAHHVLAGMFEVAQRLFGIRITPREDVQVWHPDVRFFDIYDQDNSLRGRFYVDMYARADKRGGAWMDSCRTRKRTHGETQTPVAYLTCNFTPPVGDQPALLTHDEVLTLFHEFGHGLHHMLTRADYPSVSGINGVEWDAVELPSQFLENWCWERESLDSISAHVQSGAALPDTLFDKLKASRNFQAGLKMLRQLEFALFDFRLHMSGAIESGDDIQALLDEVREEIAVVIPPRSNRFAHAFSHIFAGGYAAGYYSYKWAEILSSDAFSKFKERGIFDTKTGLEFLHEVLERGGTRDAMTSFVAFRGREPNVDALLESCGIAGADNTSGAHCR